MASEETYSGLTVSVGGNVNAKLWNQLAQNNRTVHKRVGFHGAFMEFESNPQSPRSYLESDDYGKQGAHVPLSKVVYDTDGFIDNKNIPRFRAPAGYSYAQFFGLFEFNESDNQALKIVRNFDDTSISTSPDTIADFQISDVTNANNQYRVAHCASYLVSVTEGDYFGLFLDDVNATPATGDFDQIMVAFGYGGSLVVVADRVNYGYLAARFR